MLEIGRDTPPNTLPDHAVVPPVWGRIINLDVDRGEGSWLPIPPADPTSLRTARSEAEAAAMASGRTGALQDLRRSIVDWALGQYRTAGLGAVYFSGALGPPEQRREAIEVLIDAATANLLGDVLPEKTSSTLPGRLDVWVGGPIFRIEREGA